MALAFIFHTKLKIDNWLGQDLIPFSPPNVSSTHKTTAYNAGLEAVPTTPAVYSGSTVYTLTTKRERRKKLERI
jgi:hypothetical protein